MARRAGVRARREVLGLCCCWEMLWLRLLYRVRRVSFRVAEGATGKYAAVAVAVAVAVAAVVAKVATCCCCCC